MEKKLTILMFLPAEVNTGGEKYHIKLYEYFKRQGLCVKSEYVDFPKWPRRFGLLFDCLVNNIWFFGKIKPYLKSDNLLVFEDFHWHPRLLFCNFFLKLLKKDIKIISIMQSSLFYHKALKNRFLRFWDKWACRTFFGQVVKVLCNSEYTRKEVLSIGCNPNKIAVVYCGYDVPAVQCMVKEKNNFNERLNILFVGQCIQYKGLSYLLKAVSLLANGNFDVNVVGNTESDSDYFKQLLCLRKKYALEDKVIFHGHIEDRSKLVAYYDQADIFILPSLVEGFGIVLLEAMSFGLPIISTNTGSIPELIEDGKNGILVPPADSSKLAYALNRLMCSAELRRKLGENGRSFCQTRAKLYNWDSVGERIFKEIVRLS